jgi:5'-3' exonuclease
MTKFLVDADIVAFKAATAAEQPTNWGDGLWTLHAYEQDAMEYCLNYFADLSENLGEGYISLYLTGKNNWRKNLLPTYKANRADKRKPMLLEFLRNWMQSQFNAIILEGFEADDLLGITATSSKEECIIVSEDKDLKTIPGKLFNPAKDTKPITITEFEADYNHMLQTLCGDATDGYSGCPSIGPKTAEKILADCATSADLWDATLATFKKKKLSEEVALIQAQVARICRSSEFDFDNQKVIPWTPK